MTFFFFFFEHPRFLKRLNKWKILEERVKKEIVRLFLSVSTKNRRFVIL